MYSKAHLFVVPGGDGVGRIMFSGGSEIRAKLNHNLFFYVEAYEPFESLKGRCSFGAVLCVL